MLQFLHSILRAEPVAMSSQNTTPRPSSFEACDRFFGIAELFQIFLDECPTSVLLNCTMVCRTWKEIIDCSTLLQEHLFRQPIEAGQGVQQGVQRILNPMLSYFAPILIAGSPAEHVPSVASFARPQDLISLTWARDTSMEAPSRRAFAREEASWRNMLVCQPPISRIDWWHEWVHDDPGNTGSWPASSVLDGDDGPAYGWGHQDDSRQYVTLGMLWDLVESRMVRGCTARVQFFLEGIAADADPDAHEEERYLIAENNTSRRPYGPTTPRVKITTRQVWSKVPWTGAGFDMEARKWVTMCEDRPRDCADDGFNALREDCHHDHEQPARWSRSDAFAWLELRGEASGGR
jgi:hypothetical protein